MGAPLRLCLLVVVLVSYWAIPSAALESDKVALLSIKRYFEGSGWTESDDKPCSWVGIGCTGGDGDGEKQTQIVSVNLTGLNLTGGIPLELRKLMPNLRYLDLSNNHLTGEIPNHLFSSCLELRLVNLSSNNIRGELPSGLLNCQKLQVVDLGFNRLFGPLRPQIFRMKNLETIILRFNHLSGKLPEELLNTCGNLREVNVVNNSFTGGIPSIYVNCSSITALHLSENNLRGELPKELRLLTNLTKLVLESNGFTGSIPPEIGNLPNLHIFTVANNNLCGSIPPALGKLEKLEYLSLQQNDLTGNIPAELGYLSGLKILNMNNNRLRGEIPVELCGLQSLRFFFAGSNYLEGKIPAQIGDLVQLQGLDLSFNILHGGIPSSIAKLQRLLWLSLAHNKLQGHLPLEIANCSSLLWLKAGNNRFSGELPEAMGFMGSRSQETFRLNIESGSALVPPEVESCESMRRLIPSEGSHLYATYGQAKCVAFWESILRGVAYPAPYCTYHPEVLGYIQLSSNRFTGALPHTLANFTSLGFILLSHNYFSDVIPKFLADLPLKNLDLSYNQFSGPIPAELGSLECLVGLDLTSNALEGEIPSSLASISCLRFFNISYNVGLRGPVPLIGQFVTFVDNSYMGDVNLCVGSSSSSSLKEPYSCAEAEADLKAPSTTTSASHLSPWKIALLALIVPAAVILPATCCACASLGWRWDWMLRRSVMSEYSSERVVVFDSTMEECEGVMIRLLTHRDVVKATNNFSDSCVIGKGGFGVVYKAHLPLKDGTILSVAVKRLNEYSPRAEKEFLTEMQTLGRVRHPNLAPLLGCCMAGSDKLLIYKLMSNGSLEDHLYEVRASLSDFLVRVKIAAEAAMGLRFLHHECRPLIVHRDIKPSNILLDHNFHAFITDFGLARTLAMDDDTHVSTQLFGTLGYVPPEYSQFFRATCKGDVYSFGVILFELATGKSPLDEFMTDHFCGGTVEWARIAFENGRVQEMIDPLVQSWIEASASASASNKDHIRVRKSIVFQFLKIAYECTHERPEVRPSMIQVAHHLHDLLHHHMQTSTSATPF